MGFSRQEHWSGVPFHSPGDLPDPEIKPGSLSLAGGFFTAEPAGTPMCSGMEGKASLQATSPFCREYNRVGRCPSGRVGSSVLAGGVGELQILATFLLMNSV